MKKFILICSIVVTGWVSGVAQTYPVHVNLYLLPPYSTYLSDYYAPGSNNLFANILLTDASQPQLDVVFKITVIGDKLKLTLKPNLPIAPITIYGGVPLRLDGADLASYFLPQNLNVEGEGSASFFNGGKLPEGYYIFSVEVVEYYRKVVISNQALAFAWVVLNEPPQWITPANQTRIPANEPQNVFFSWMPLHMGSPNSAFTTQYAFTLCEMPSADVDPSVVLASTNPVFTDEVPTTTLIYGPGNPTLEPGKYYVAQVRAFDTENRDLFKNNGLSKPVVFKFGELCKTPIFINHNSVTRITATFDWTPSDGNSSYAINLRQNDGNGLTDWYSYEATEAPYTVKQLAPQTKYEYQIKAICGNEYTGISSPYSTIGSFTTMEGGNASYNCNDVVPNPVIAGTTKAGTLKVGQQINAGGFTSTIARVDKAENGVFSGLCQTILPVWGIKIYCKFTDISININNQVLSGDIVALRAEEVTWANGEGPDGTDGGTDGTDDDGYNDLDDFTADSLIIADTPIDSVVVTPDSTIIIYESDGTTTEVAITDNIQVEDPGNNVYVVEDGKVYKNPPGVSPSTGGAGKPEYDKLLTVNFSHAGTMQYYGFDKHNPQIPAFDAQYNKIQVHRNSYFADWVSVASYKTDVTQAAINLQGATGNYSDVKFRTPTGPIFPTPAGTDSTYYVMLQGGANGTEQEIECFYKVTDVNGKEKEVTAGQLNVASYDETSVNVCLVSVNGTQYPYSTQVLQMQLNQIFKQAVAKVTITTTSLTGVVWDIDNNGKLSADETSAISTYNPEMKELRSALKAAGSYNSEPSYLFLVPASDDASLAGYMPLSRQYGFIPLNAGGNNTEQKITRTIAHELSHGVFRLRHTFSPNNQYIAPQGATTNLMDYTSNPDDRGLIKYQWDYVHDPESMLGFLQDDEEGESMICLGIFDDCDDVLKKIEAIKKAYNEGKTVIGKVPESLNEKILIGTQLKLGDVEYDKIMVCLYGEANKDYTINPKEYSEFWYTVTPYETDPEKKILNGGFEFKFEDKHVLRIFVEANSLVVQEKFSALKKYLFEQSESDGNANQPKQYEISEIKNDAEDVADDIPGTESQCNIGSRLFLEKITGDKVYILNHLVD
ncbi:MAG: fibronectin type III domain-containing protein [Salinivirgaceae bacterium]